MLLGLLHCDSGNSVRIRCRLEPDGDDAIVQENKVAGSLEDGFEIDGDNGTYTGNKANGVAIGGHARTGCVELTEWNNEIALGNPDTPYRLRLTIVPPEVTKP